MSDGKTTQQAYGNFDPTTGELLSLRQGGAEKELPLLSARQIAALAPLIPGSASVRDTSGQAVPVNGIAWPMRDGAGAVLAPTRPGAPSITLAGGTAGAWDNPGWLTHDAAGTTVRLLGNKIANGLVDMATEGAILIGMDLQLAAWPSSTETAWSIHRSELGTGGVRMVMVGGAPSAGRLGVYYRASGGSDSERIGYVVPTYLGTRISTLTEIRSMPAAGLLQLTLWVNGRMQRSNVVPLVAAPVPDPATGLCFSGHGSTPNQRLGTGGSGARTALAYCLRHSGANRNIGGRLAAHVWATGNLPAWIKGA